jgi:hypothetical protein
MRAADKIDDAVDIVNHADDITDAVSHADDVVDSAKQLAKDPYSRPSGYPEGFRDQVFDSAKGTDGFVRDPQTQAIMDPSQPWDMGHKPGLEFSKHQQSARERGITRQEFRSEYYNQSHYRPELPSSNRNHRGEAGPDIDLYP